MPAAFCPVCDGLVTVRGKTNLGKRANCRNCAAQLVVVGLDPLELDLADKSREEEEEEEEDDDGSDG